MLLSKTGDFIKVNEFIFEKGANSTFINAYVRIDNENGKLLKDKMEKTWRNALAFEWADHDINNYVITKEFDGQEYLLFSKSDLEHWMVRTDALDTITEEMRNFIIDWIND